MRLLFVSNLFPDTREPDRGLDNATLLHEIAKRSEIRTLAFRPVLPWSQQAWKARPEDAALHPKYVATFYVPKIGHRWNHRLYTRALRRAASRLREDWNWDVVLCAWLFPDACAVARLQREFGWRFVAIAQGSDVHQYLQIPVRRQIIASHVAMASAVITRSAELARLLGEAGVPKERLHPIYNGVDGRVFHPGTSEMREAARAELGIPPAARMILFVGNFLPVKNPELLLQAHARLLGRPDFADLYLVLIGEGPLQAALEERVQELGTAGRVRFAGRRDAQGVAQAMREADVLALPSHNEGVPNVILEAFASGLPVVASKVGGIPEVHHGDEFGRLVSPGDEAALVEALEQTLRAPPDRQRIAKYGETFNWAGTAEAYDRLLSAKGTEG